MPGTHVVQGIKELLHMYDDNIEKALNEENFASKGDLIAMAHDLRYLLASQKPPVEEGDPNDLVKKADEKFVQLSKDKAKTDEDKLNLKVPAIAVGAKLKAENIASEFGKNRVAGDEKLRDSDFPLMKHVLMALERRGYGPKKRIVNRPLRIIEQNDKMTCPFGCSKRKFKRENLNHHLKGQRCMAHCQKIGKGPYVKTGEGPFLFDF